MSASVFKLLLLVANLVRFCCSTVWAKSHTTRSGPVSNQTSHHVFNYVIIGAGPGGLVMANRLTEQSNVSFAVIKAGTWPEDIVGNLTEVPGYNGFFNLKAANATPSGVDWGFLTTPQTVSHSGPL